MAKRDIKHSCGHEEMHSLFGKHADRERKAAWLESQPCSACRRAERQAQGPAFLARFLPAVDPSELARRADELQPRIDAARENYQRELDRVGQMFPDAVALIESGSETYSTDLHKHAINARRELRKIEETAASLRERAARTTPRPARIEIACYENSYDIKDELKARGYKFSDACPRPGSGNLIYGTGKGWVVQIAEPEEIATELVWIKKSGYRLAVESQIVTTLRAVIDGRPELAGL